MCGICGIFKFDNVPPDSKRIKNMTSLLSHRGPDGEGFFSDQNLAFGHRRLSIIDLSEKGKQPMHFEDKIITYNGEIYNYIEIRQKLIERGYLFQSETDTEVILKAYEEFGPTCLSLFNGMFSFAIYDRSKKELFCARDRFGIKPFYYSINKDCFVFASEIKPVFVGSEIKPEANNEILMDYISTNRTDHCKDTCFQNISRLMPGHYLLVKDDGLTISEKWYDLRTKIKSQNFSSERLYTEFRKSVDFRLRSDVEVGSCLSGGLDSSLIVSMMSKRVSDKDKIKTFSAVYANSWEKNEKKYVEEVCKKLEVKNSQTIPDSKVLLQDLEKLILHQEEPVTSASVFAGWEVMKIANEENIKVLLDGQGADELFAGYPYMVSAYYRELMSQGSYGKLFNEFFSFFGEQENSKFDGIKYFLFFFLTPKSIRRKLLKERVSWISHDFYEKNYSDNFVESFFSVDSLNQFLLNHVDFKLAHLLRYEDKNSMAFSVEARVPFLDHNLVEYAFSLPSNYKIRNGITKLALRSSFKSLIPKKIIKRKDKVGFETPEHLWFRDKSFIKMFEDIIDSESFQERECFESSEIKTLFNKFKDGDNSNLSIIWKVLYLELWHRIFIDKPNFIKC